MKREISTIDAIAGASGLKFPASTHPDCAAPQAIGAHQESAGQPRFPSGSCDCHAHVFPSPSLYPLYAGRSYTPHICTLEMYLELLQILGIERAVLVQPSVYGTDNSALLHALRKMGDSFRGVAVPSPGSSDAQLHAMHTAGVRGIRLNLANPSVLTLKDAIRLCQRVAQWDWHLQIHMNVSGQTIDDLLAIMDSVDCPVVLDHFGRICPAHIPPALIRLLEGGRTWIKLSAPYRVEADFPSLQSAVARLYQVAPDRVLWGSDWPHTEQVETPAHTELLRWMNDCFPCAEVRRQILVVNPNVLYFSP